VIIGTIRPIDIQTITVHAATLEEIKALIADQTPPGWELTAAPVRMSKTDNSLSCEATISRRDQVTQFEAEDLDDLRSRLPEGHQILSIIRE
jgi:hypothetical protein